MIPSTPPDVQGSVSAVEFRGLGSGWWGFQAEDASRFLAQDSRIPPCPPSGFPSRQNHICSASGGERPRPHSTPGRHDLQPRPGMSSLNLQTTEAYYRESPHPGQKKKNNKKKPFQKEATSKTQNQEYRFHFQLQH